MLYIQCKILHRVLLRINTLSSVKFLCLKWWLCKKNEKYQGCSKYMIQPYEIYITQFLLWQKCHWLFNFGSTKVSKHMTQYFSLLPFATTPVKSRSTQIKPRIKGHLPVGIPQIYNIHGSDEMLLLLREHSNEVVSLICISWDILGLRYMWRLLLTIHTLRNRYCVFQSWLRQKSTTNENILSASWKHLEVILRMSLKHLWTPESILRTSETSDNVYNTFENIWTSWEPLRTSENSP